MLRLCLLVPLLPLLTFCQDVELQDSQIVHAQSNIERMAQLRARWYKKHPLTFPPLSEENLRFVKEYSRQHANDDNSISYDAKQIEGDIIPSDEDIIRMEKKLREDELGEADLRTKRVTSDTRYKSFPIDMPIPYTIAPEFNMFHKFYIGEAINTIAQNTCIDFLKEGPGPKLEYSRPKNENETVCNSHVGDRRNGSNQIILLGQGCLTPRSVIHETMHALGFDHTQSRGDRDNYIEINDEAINATKENNFEKIDSFDSYSLPYDYNSVMHYSSTAFSKDDITPTIIPKNPYYLGSVGGYHGPTFNDWKSINIRYKCSDKCQNGNQCKNNGYPHPRDCTKCVCPIFYNGTYCENEINVIDLHQGEAESVPHIHVAMLPIDSYKMTLPNIPFVVRTDYEHSDISQHFFLFDVVRRTIKAPEGMKIRATIDLMIGIGDMENCPRACAKRGVEIVDGDLSVVGMRFCCRNQIGYSVVSKSNVIGFQSYSSPIELFVSKVTFSIEDPTESWDDKIEAMMKRVAENYADFTNEEKADILQQNLASLNGREEFYIMVYDDFTGYHKHSVTHLPQNGAHQWREGNCNMLICRSLTSWQRTDEEFKEMERMVEEIRNIRIDADRKGGLLDDAKSIYHSITEAGFVAIIRDTNVAIRSTGHRAAGPGWVITTNAANIYTGSVKVVVGFK